MKQIIEVFSLIWTKVNKYYKQMYCLLLVILVNALTNVM